MNIFDIHEKSGVSLRALRKLDKMGVLRCKPNDPILDAIRLMLSSSKPLSVAQLAALIDNPGLVLELGKKADAAELQLEGIGDAKGEAAPRSVTLHIEDAARSDPAAVAKIAMWIFDNLPSYGAVNYSYVALRLLYGVPEGQRQFVLPRIARAISYAKQQAPLSHCWRMTGKEGAKRTEFFKPNPLDL
jgi:hypothetical protein